MAMLEVKGIVIIINRYFVYVDNEKDILGY